MRLTGNKGEWSELYAFIKLLSTGTLYAADENTNRIENVYFPILKIFRSESDTLDMEYVIKSEDNGVEVHWHAETVRTLDQSQLRRYAAYLYSCISQGGNRAFEIDGSKEIMDEIACTKIVAPSTDKTDITMQLHDIQTGYSPVCGFSIKSELGNPPTLLNASGATNFVYEVNGISDEQAERINNIDTRNKIIDRVEAIYQEGNLKYKCMANKIFSNNLMFIDTYMEEIIANLLLDYYHGGVSDCKTLVERLEEKNPLGYPRAGIYEYKVKKFLCSVALGLTPSRVWDGRDEANGGYVIVKNDGDVVAYHIYNRDAFETYLLNNTKLERGSTSRHRFASIYTDESGNKYINLNLQIRFV